MRRITFLVILSYFLMGCGGGKETVPEISVSEEQIASSLVQQKGERPTISPETLSPKVPPQKIISSSKAAPKVSAPKKVQRAVKKKKNRFQNLRQPVSKKHLLLKHRLRNRYRKRSRCRRNP